MDDRQLRLLAGFADELAYVDGRPTAHTVHPAAECAKLAFADREAFYGDDPDLPLTDLLAFGTPGGDQQDQWQLCFWLAHTVGGLNLQAAIDAPAWHSNAFPNSFFPRSWAPGELVVESRVGDAAIAELRARGHTVVDGGAWELGRMSCVARDARTGLLRAAANPRGMQGYAVGR
jgi:gamma-glutamyltranspeptidase